MMNKFMLNAIAILQSARDRYRDLTAVSTGMNRDLVLKFIKVNIFDVICLRI